MSYNPKLIWAKYNKNNKYYLLLHLGNYNNKAICMLSRSISNATAAVIKKGNPNVYNFNQFLSWIKDIAPDVYKSSYREFPLDQLDIRKRFDIDG